MMNYLVKNEDGNEILGFVIVALITTVVGGILLLTFSTGAQDIFDSMISKIQAKIAF